MQNKLTLFKGLKKNAFSGMQWGWFDFANSSYYLIFVVLTLPLFLSEKVFANVSDFPLKWGIAQGLAVLLGVVIAFAFSNKLDNKTNIEYISFSKIAFLLPSLLSFIFPILVFEKASPNVFLYSFVIVHGVYLASLIYYDSTVVNFQKGKDRIEISGWAWGFGYLGGVACLIVLKIVEIVFNVNSYHPVYFFIASLFFLVFSLIAYKKFLLFAGVFCDTEKKIDINEMKLFGSVTTSNIIAMFVFMLLIMDGIAVFIGYMSLYWKSIQIDNETIVGLLFLLQLLAFPFSGLTSSITRFSFRTLLLFCGFMWLIAGLVSVYISTLLGAILSVIIVSMVLGASQALLRVIFSEMIIPEKKLFGFSVFAFIEKGAAFIGPILAGLAITIFGFKIVLSVSALMILIGCFGLSKVIRIID